jgi:ABC-type nitrate/sulfonate/bicarbonate transport system permease component
MEKSNDLTQGTQGQCIKSQEIRLKRKKSRQPLWVSLVQSAIIIAFLIILQFVADNGYINPTFVASPTQVFEEFTYMIKNHLLLPHLSLTLQEALVGYVISAITGVTIGVLFVSFPKIELVFSPFFSAVMSVPKTALLPLLIIWFGIGFKNKVVVVFLFGMFNVLFNTVTGAKLTKTEHLKVAAVFKATHLQIIFKVMLPSALPNIFNGLRVTAATTITGVVFAEMTVSKGGMGYLLSEAQQILNTPELFLIIILVTIISVLFVALVNFAEYMTCRKWRSNL